MGIRYVSYFSLQQRGEIFFIEAFKCRMRRTLRRTWCHQKRKESLSPKKVLHVGDKNYPICFLIDKKFNISQYQKNTFSF